jgi:hypothetical protein
VTRLICAISIVGLLAASGCSSRSDLTAVSSKNVSLNPLRVDPAQSKGRTRGEDCVHIIIIIPTGGVPTIDEAIDRALEPKGANLLTDAVVTWTSWYIPYIYGLTCWTVEGDAHDTFQ